MCFGGSISSMMSPRGSMKFSGSSCVTGICVPPISDENSAVSRLTSIRSWCLTTFQ